MHELRLNVEFCTITVDSFELIAPPLFEEEFSSKSTLSIATVEPELYIPPPLFELPCLIIKLSTLVVSSRQLIILICGDEIG